MQNKIYLPPLCITVKRDITFRSKKEQMAFYKVIDVSGCIISTVGINVVGWGFILSPTDMAKIRHLFLNGGICSENRIVSEKWIAESPSEQSQWKQRNLSYGYLWWIGEQGNGYAAIGNGGNIIFVNPEKKMVV